MPRQRAKSETAAAKQGFEDYYNLGMERTLSKLWAVYEARIAAGGQAPARGLRTLLMWSADHGWVKRAAARETEENEALWQAMLRSRTKEKMRDLRRVERVLMGHDAHMVQMVINGKPSPKEYSATELATLIKLRQSLMGSDLSDPVKLAGPDGGPVQLEIETQLDVSNEQFARFLSSAANVLRSGDSQGPMDAGTKTPADTGTNE